MNESFERCLRRPIFLACVPIIECPLITPIPVLSLLLCSLSRVALPCALYQTLSYFSRRSVLVRSCPRTVDEVHNCIVNYKPVENLSTVMVVAKSSLVVKSSALQLPEISLCSGIRYLCSYRFATSLRHLRKSYTVLEFITLELGKYCNSSLVNIFTHNNFHHSLNCQNFAWKPL